VKSLFKIALVVAGLSCGCNHASGPPTVKSAAHSRATGDGAAPTVQHSSPTREQVEAVAAASMKMEVEHSEFPERMARVQKGWTEKQVLDLLGVPKEKSDNGCVYHWSESWSRGGLFHIYTFRFSEGVVVNIHHGGGCALMPPPR
jgi:hypothetical protein